MRVVRNLVAAAILLTGATPAAAERWYRVMGDRTGVAYVDADSIGTRGEMRTANVYSVFGEPRGELHAGSIRQEFNCAENYFRTIEYSYFGADNRLLGTSPSNDPVRRRPVVAESFNGAFFRFVCEGAGGVAVRADPWTDSQAFLRGLRAE